MTPGELLVCDIRSVSERPLRDLARRVATVWAESEFAPDRAGFSERTTLLRDKTLADRLEAAWVEGREVDELWMTSALPGRGFSASLRLFADLQRPTDHGVDFLIEMDKITADDLDSVVDLACELFVAIDGCVGFLDTSPITRQRTALRAAGDESGAVAALAPVGDHHSWEPEHWLEGPFWVSLFGPAIAGRWSSNTVETLGVGRRKLADGSVMVQTIDTPPARDDTVTTLLGYPHQQALADQVGENLFVHEGHGGRLPDAGEYVPTRDDHAAPRP